MAYRNNIDKITAELTNAMLGERLTEGLSAKKPTDRIGAFQKLLIESIRNSTLCCFNGRPYCFNGQIYEPLSNEGWEAFNSIVLRVADRCGLPPGDQTRLETVKKVCRGEVILQPLEPDNSIIVLQNGVLNVDKGTFHKFGKRFKQVTQMSFDYNPNMVPNVWTDSFLDSVLEKHQQKILQEFMGAIFLDRKKVKIEKMLILYGAGSNGKSVIHSTLIGMLGEENVKTIAISDLISGSERKQNVASINGKRLNYCSEIQAKEFGRNADALKALISGEPVEVRQVYVNNFTARNIPLLMANANKIPKMNDVSHGLARRIIVIEFQKIIEEKNQNKMLAKELQKEYAGILNWILAGRQRLIENKYQFTDSLNMQEKIEEYQAENSTVLQYMRAKEYSRSIEDVAYAPRWLSAEKLYRAYQKWCFQKNIEPETDKMFYRTLNEAGYAKSRHAGGSVYAVYNLNPRPIKEEFKGKDVNGMVDGQSELAHYCGVSRQTIEKMMRNNLLEGCYVKRGRRYWFKLEQSRIAVRKFLKGYDKRGEDPAKADKQLKADRRAFNTYMRNKKLPFRKVDKFDPHAEGIIFVRDEFNYQLDKDDWKNWLRFPERQNPKDFSGLELPEISDNEENVENENEE